MTENDIEEWHNNGSMPFFFSMEEFDEMVGRIKAEAWKQGRESVAHDMLKSLDESGVRPVTPNPYGEV